MDVQKSTPYQGLNATQDGQGNCGEKLRKRQLSRICAACCSKCVGIVAVGQFYVSVPITGPMPPAVGERRKVAANHRDETLIVMASDERNDVARVRPRCLKLRVSSKSQ